MSQDWQDQRVPLRFQVSDLTFFAPELKLQVREVGLADELVPQAVPQPPTDPLPRGSAGYLIRSLPVATVQPPLRLLAEYLCYVPTQYKRFYIDLRTSFDDYKAKFSSKTRSTINRKVKRFAEHCGGTVRWHAYKTPDEIREFHSLARQVSARTYQERLLDAGLPGAKEFLLRMEQLAMSNRMRGYILFDRDRPVAYLYCPVYEGVVLYTYLGYDPDYANWSVGTVLQWCALEDLFREAQFRAFDFTEGESDHKRQFATHSIQCANVLFLRKTVRNVVLANAHHAVDTLSANVGTVLTRLGLKARVRRWIRLGK
jgi:CelD/BcsL family acetyltransferase involved in cellulose biosynthesis